MPNKTLSVREEDLALWERAGRAAERERMSLSALVATALARHLGDTDTCKVFMYDGKGGPARVEQFVGRWLTYAPPVGSETVWLPDDDNWGSYERERDLLRNWGFTFGHDDPPSGNELRPTDWRTAAAETAKGRVAIYLWHWNFDYNTPPELRAFDTVDDAERALGKDPRVRTVGPEDAYHSFWADLRTKLSKPTMVSTGSGTHSIVWRDI